MATRRPSAIRMSPTEYTLASGTQCGAAQRSTSAREVRGGELDAVVVDLVVGAGRAQRRAADRHQAAVRDDRDDVAEESGCDQRCARQPRVQQQHRHEQAVRAEPDRARHRGGRRPWQQIDGERDELQRDRGEREALAADVASASVLSRPPSSLPSTSARRVTSTKTIRVPLGRWPVCCVSRSWSVETIERVELSAALGPEFVHRGLDRDAGAVGAVGRQRVESVGDEDQP